MNPAEIYEKHPHADAYRVGGFYSPYCLVSREKRFSDAELAAEFHSALACFSVEEMESRPPAGLIVNGRPTDEGDKADIFYRFLTLPHYDEADQ